MEKEMKDLPALLTVEEMANFLKIEKNKAYNLIYKKQVPVLKLGSIIRIPKCLFIRWIEKNTSNKFMV
ncbi:helix-turn-helix domain-containing protein [Clostridium botulinum]|uniref:DNA-binding protein n=1 Tax=Clostridium botulinum TaxID=1491 RepID=A0A9Q1ZB33_CLOBO|nr:helix-turn-helix domain-containing protein [Clostridium botulinum]AEB77491.1 putative DNA-binding protein [Clostridium botulinum BKT015925]KEH96075.1 putative DNA-binding protein [Clostridium botulinum C/D str. Sp77]KEH96890.1 DNA-binding protein [Clostridium botulinum D str. 16868]KLU74651.1 DNA-binding protein [Clostridium botulinum V891]KOA75838.1 DNA-binding protein [Clostridium botulinum]